MEIESIEDFLDVKNYSTFSFFHLDKTSVLLCFTTKPASSDSEFLLYRKWNVRERQVVRKSLKFIAEKTIKAHAFCPNASWQAVLTALGGIYILPIRTLLGEEQPSRGAWNRLDSTNLNTRLAGQPECLLWWRTYRQEDVAIVGFKAGQVMFIDLTSGALLTQVEVGGRIDLCQLVRTCDNTSVFCLITSSIGNQWRLALEERAFGFHEPCLAVDEAMDLDELGAFEQLDMSDMPTLCIFQQEINRQLKGAEGVAKFEPQKMYQFPQSVLLRYQTYDDKHFVSGFNSNKNRLNMYDAAGLDSPALFIFRICETALDVLVHETLIYAVHKNPGGGKELQLSVYCRQHAHCPAGEDASRTFSFEDARRAKLTEFPIDDGPLVGLFLLPDCLAPVFTRSLPQWTSVPPVLVVTAKKLFLVHQKQSYDERFLHLLLKEHKQLDAEWLGVGLKLDLNWLYERAAETVCAEGRGSYGIVARTAMKRAGEYFELARTPMHRRIQCLADSFPTKELLRKLQALARKPDSLTNAERGCVANALLVCFARLLANQPADQGLREKFRSFMVKNFHFNQMKAVYVLLDFGLVADAFFLCRERGLLVEAVQHLRDNRWACNASQCRMPIDDSFRRELIINDRAAIFSNLTPQDLELLVLSSPQLLSSLAEEATRFVAESSVEDRVLESLLHGFHPAGLPLQRLRSLTEEPERGASLRQRARSFGESYSLSDSFLSPRGEGDLGPVISKMLLAYVSIVLCRRESDWNEFEFMTLWQRSKAPKYKRTESVSACPAALDLHPAAIAVAFASQLHVLSSPDLPIRAFRRRVRDLSCGQRHALVVDSNGVLFSCGNNTHGQLGVDPSSTTFPSTSTWRANLSPLVDLPAIRAVMAGHYHSLAITADDGTALAWGWGLHGQLGTGSIEDGWRPERVPLAGGGGGGGGRCIAMAAGAHHSMLLRDDGRVLVFGGNQFGQLGRDDVVKSSEPLLLMDITRPVKAIASRYFHSMCVTTDNRVYQWGIHPNTWSHLDERTAFDVVCHPRRLRIPSEAPVIQVACGSNHSLALCSDGSVFACGKNNFGQLGTGNKTNLKSDMAQVEELTNVTRISADNFVSTALDSTGGLFMWGHAGHPVFQNVYFNAGSEFLVPTCVTEFSSLPNLGSPDLAGVKMVHKAELMFSLENWMGYLDNTMFEYLVTRKEFAILADMMLQKRNFLPSLVWRLRSFEASDLDVSHQMKAVTEFYISEVEDTFESPKLLKPILFTILQWFQKKGYPLQQLEAILTPRLQRIACTLMTTIDKLHLEHAFTPKFMVNLFTVWERQLNFNPDACPPSQSMPFISITTRELISELDNSQRSSIYCVHNSSERKIIIFACGHRFAYSIFKNDLVPELIRDFQQHKSIGLDGIKASYSDDKDYVLCPVCVRKAYFPTASVPLL